MSTKPKIYSAGVSTTQGVDSAGEWMMEGKMNKVITLLLLFGILVFTLYILFVGSALYALTHFII